MKIEDGKVYWPGTRAEAEEVLMSVPDNLRVRPWARMATGTSYGEAPTFAVGTAFSRVKHAALLDPAAWPLTLVEA